MGGYECTDQLNTHGDRVDFLHVTDHLRQIREDYGLLKEFNIKTVREGLRWSQVERQPYHYDFSTLDRMLEAGGGAAFNRYGTSATLATPTTSPPYILTFPGVLKRYAGRSLRIIRRFCPTKRSLSHPSMR